MKIIGTNTTRLVGIEPREGELLITKIQRAKKQGELIKDVAGHILGIIRIVPKLIYSQVWIVSLAIYQFRYYSYNA